MDPFPTTPTHTHCKLIPVPPGSDSISLLRQRLSISEIAAYPCLIHGYLMEKVKEIKV